MSIDQVLVAGSGAMGSQIAMVAALAGCTVTVYDVDAARVEQARQHLLERMDAQVTKGRRTREAVDAAFQRLTATTSLADAGAVDLVIEAIVERLPAKRELFAELDGLCPARTVFASNSSSFVPSSMATATTRADRFLNLHFFNPALVMPCVEVVRGPDTASPVVEACLAFVERIGKTAVVLDKEIPGFVANRLLGAVRDEALRLLEGGYADVEAIDTAARTALGYPMGPFELMDLTGIDIGYLTKTARFEVTGDAADAPSRTVSALVEQGHLGRKTGRGFYTYGPSGDRTGVTDLADLKGQH
ncbi:3-hydroxyacyl-CoA dehydrogenase family protein [Nocardioides sp.]|uniref:3-hydroxyacyl-CoA dehydrogenase family protein n=1 Tax=Nocardioides sp. TaxID=35761 RepID=UPI0025E64E9D|nr:3-hydroxyacyl-CoA dehydrogenase family protein [Nocardioides sp.]